MKRIKAWLSALCMLAGLTACSSASPTGYTQLTAEQAKAMMDGSEGYILLDVRAESEYLLGHIPGAVVLPHDGITADTAAALLPDKGQTILVYCRSGRRSKIAADTLVGLGYTAVYEFGGINDWPYATTR